MSAPILRWGRSRAAARRRAAARKAAAEAAQAASRARVDAQVASGLALLAERRAFREIIASYQSEETAP